MTPPSDMKATKIARVECYIVYVCFWLSASKSIITDDAREYVKEQLVEVGNKDHRFLLHIMSSLHTVQYHQFILLLLLTLVSAPFPGDFLGYLTIVIA